jgi:PTS system mannose-specific IIC component
VNLGAALPVHEALGTAAIAGGAVLAGRALGSGTSPEVAVLAVLICAPIALAGRRADRLVEVFNEKLALRAEQALAHHEPRAAVRLNLFGLALPFAIAAVLAPAGAAVARVLIPAFLRAVPAAAPPLRLGFFAFSGLACASGAKALRAKDAPRIFIASLGIALIVALAAGRLHA